MEKSHSRDEIEQVGGSRFIDIADCDMCNGEPPEEPFELPTMIGVKCGKCWEVLGWKRK